MRTRAACQTVTDLLLDRPREVRHGESVYRVTEVVGVSSESWEAAARVAIETAGKSVRDCAWRKSYARTSRSRKDRPQFPYSPGDLFSPIPSSAGRASPGAPRILRTEGSRHGSPPVCTRPLGAVSVPFWQPSPRTGGHRMPRYMVHRTWPTSWRSPSTTAVSTSPRGRRAQRRRGRELGSLVRQRRQAHDLLHLRRPHARGDPQGGRTQQPANDEITEVRVLDPFSSPTPTTSHPEGVTMSTSFKCLLADRDRRRRRWPAAYAQVNEIPIAGSEVPVAPPYIGGAHSGRTAAAAPSSSSFQWDDAGIGARASAGLDRRRRGRRRCLSPSSTPAGDITPRPSGRPPGR